MVRGDEDHCVRVLIVDDKRAFAEAVAVLIDIESDLSVVGIVGTGAEAEHAIALHRPEVVLVDVELNGESGIALTGRILAEDPSIHVLIVSGHYDSETICAAIRAGAAGFVAKDSAAQDLVKAIRGVVRGEAWIAARHLTGVLEAFRQHPAPANPDETRLNRLSKRELEVLTLMVRGLDRAGIARRLYLSTNTVRTHTQNVLSKLEVHSSLEAVSLALRAGVRPTSAGV